jgi:MFS family permease
LSAEQSHPVRAQAHEGTVISILFIAGVIYALFASLMLPSIPHLTRALHTTSIDAAWVLTAYILSSGVATPIAGRLGDMYGKTRTLVWTLTIVAAGTLVCALATSLVPLIIGRVICGVASGVFPLAYGIIRDEFDEDRVATGIGVISVSVGVGSGAGAILAGVILAHLGYHWLFWLPLALVVPTAAAAWRLIPESPVRAGGRVDWFGAVLLGIGLLIELLTISKASQWTWTAPRTLVLLFTGLAILAAWVMVELRTGEPLIDMRTMGRRTVWRTNLAAALFGLGMYAAYAMVPQFVQEPRSTGYGYAASIVGAGLFLLPATIGQALLGPLAGRIALRVGSKPALVAGGAFGTVGFALIAASHQVHWHVYAGMGIAGIGLGLGFAALPNLIVGAVPTEQTGAATGINTIVRVLGGAVGIQICATILARHLVHPGGLPGAAGFTAAFWVCAAGLAAASIAALVVPGRTQRAPLVEHAGLVRL